MNARHLLDRMLEVGFKAEPGPPRIPPTDLGLLTPPAKQLLASFKQPDGLAVLEELARRAMGEEDAVPVELISATAGAIAPLSDEARARVLLKAVIAAAKVDGRISTLQDSTSAGGQA